MGLLNKKKKPEAMEADVVEPEISPVSPAEVPEVPKPSSQYQEKKNQDSRFDKLDDEVKATIEELQARYLGIYETPQTFSSAQADERNTLLIALLTEQRKTNSLLQQLIIKVME